MLSEIDKNFVKGRKNEDQVLETEKKENIEKKYWKKKKYPFPINFRNI